MSKEKNYNRHNSLVIRHIERYPVQIAPLPANIERFFALLDEIETGKNRAYVSAMRVTLDSMVDRIQIQLDHYYRLVNRVPDGRCACCMVAELDSLAYEYKKFDAEVSRILRKRIFEFKNALMCLFGAKFLNLESSSYCFDFAKCQILKSVR